MKRILDLNQGKIEVENRDYGGCAVTVQLPVDEYMEDKENE